MVGPSEISKSRPVDPIFEPLVLLGCERQRRLVVEFSISEVTNKEEFMYKKNRVLTIESMSETQSEKVVSVSSRGQATIPKQFREQLGIDTPGRVKFIQTEAGEIVVRPIQSLTDLRGILTGKTDDQGRSGTERLQAERTADKANEERLRQQYTDDDEIDP